MSATGHPDPLVRLEEVARIIDRMCFRYLDNRATYGGKAVIHFDRRRDIAFVKAEMILALSSQILPLEDRENGSALDESAAVPKSSAPDAAAILEALRTEGFDHAMVGFMRGCLTSSDGIIDGEDEAASQIMRALSDYLQDALTQAVKP